LIYSTSATTQITKNSWQTNQTTAKINDLRTQMQDPSLSPEEQLKNPQALLLHQQNKNRVAFERRNAVIQATLNEMSGAASPPKEPLLQSLPSTNDPLHNERLLFCPFTVKGKESKCWIL